jgi:hypothetical protein
MAQNGSGEKNLPRSQDADEFQPRGTFVILLIFMLVLIILWASVYLILVSRGVTI